MASLLKLNLTDPCRIVPCQYHCLGMPGRQAGSPIAVCARVQCREPKTGQKKVQFCCEDDWLWPSCYYLSMTVQQAEQGRSIFNMQNYSVSRTKLTVCVTETARSQEKDDFLVNYSCFLGPKPWTGNQLYTFPIQPFIKMSQFLNCPLDVKPVN